MRKKTKKCEQALEVITDLSVHLDFKDINSGRDFHRIACEFFGERCGRSTHSCKNKDERFWFQEAKKGREMPYHCTPAANKRKREWTGDETPVAPRPGKQGRY